VITKEIALAAHHGTVFHHVTLRNADGTPLRARVNGKCRTWVRKPDEFSLPIKHGLREYGYIDEINGVNWAITACAAIVEGP
jgi:hypothetical protein